MLLTLFLLTFIKDTPFLIGSLAQAQAQAEKQGKLLLVDFYTDWCGPCKLLERTTFKDAQVLDVFAKDVLVLRINAEVGPGVIDAGQFQVRAYPTLLVLSPKGEELKRQLGYVSARDLLQLLASCQPAPLATE